jgi:hypothetical protein
MLFSRFSEQELRQESRIHLETLELWLRRLVVDQVSPVKGEGFLNSVDEKGNRFLKKDKIEKIENRMFKEPARYPRMIDAVLLDELIYIICHPEHYKNFFLLVFKRWFIGEAHVRHVLTTLVDPRNRLSHANAISLRQSEQIICYTNDIIDCLKEYYLVVNKSSSYNAPSIIRIWDNFGNVNVVQQPIVNLRVYSFTQNPKFFLRPGDVLTIEIEIDPTFPLNECKIYWNWPTGYSIPDNDAEKTKLILPLSNGDVSETCQIVCRVKSNKDWHRFGEHDDGCVFNYTVLPPI